MDREREFAHLIRAEKAIAESRKHIADQEQRVAELDRDGHDTQRALSVLGLYRCLQAQHLAQRRLVLQLLRLTNQSERSSGPIFRPGHYDAP
jgi:exonuclease VII small subunit